MADGESMVSAMRVLGVDPGLTRCGVGIVDGAVGSAISLVEVGIILTPTDSPLEQRLLDLDQQLSQWINVWKPDVIAVERVFSQHNVRTVMGTGQAAGIALLLAAKAGIPVMMHTPSEVKASVTGNGRSNKAQVAQMVQKILRLDSVPKPVDATDALALAICHIWRGAGTTRLATAAAEEQVRIKKLRSR
ncbi:MAG: crossover junction endodeoxyribonuclease RuvC [Actinomycetales bacterium]|nr:crossover junction endodeoxyribonuclease RuvC [Actinomycetales bacterium]